MRFSRGGTWRPLGTIGGYKIVRPEIGDVVAYARAAWEVTHVRVDIPTDEDLERINAYRPEYRDRQMPYSLGLRRLHGPRHDSENDRQEMGVGIRAAAHYVWSRYDEGRVPLCSCCGHPWPCLMTDAKAESEYQAEVLNERMARAGVGLCYSCGEVITHRQGSVTYPEGNVDLPGYPAPRFHTRQKCYGERYAYEKRRAKALPDAESLLDAEREGLL